MKWRAKDKVYDTNWHEVFVWYVDRTEDGYTVVMEKIWRKFKVHMATGSYVYRVRKEG